MTVVGRSGGGDKSRVRTMRDQVEVLAVAEGFFQSDVLFALLKLRIFDLVGDGAKTVDQVAEAVQGSPETVGRLLRAGVALELLDVDGDGAFIVSGPCRRVLLPSAGDDYIGDWILNLEFFQDALRRLDQAVLRGGPTVSMRADLAHGGEQTRQFTLAMHLYASLRGRELAHFLDTTNCKTLLDAGCGPGTYAFQLASANPELEVFLLDLPDVLRVTEEIEEQFDLGGRTNYVPADLLTDEIPGNYDLVLVSNTLHMLGEEASRSLIQRLVSSVNPAGSLVIQAQFLRNDGLGGRWPVLLDLIQLVITEHGRNHTVAETKRWLQDAGFGAVEFCPMDLGNTNSYLRAYRSKSQTRSVKSIERMERRR